MQQYELNIKSAIKFAIGPIFWFVIIIFVLPYIFLSSINSFDIIRHKFQDTSGLFVLLIPIALYLYILFTEYKDYLSILVLSKNIKVEINNDLKIISIQRNELKKYFSFDQILSVDLYKSFTENGPSFYYIVIELKDKNEIIITSLMTKDDNIKIDIPNQLELPMDRRFRKRDPSKLYNYNSALFKAA